MDKEVNLWTIILLNLSIFSFTDSSTTISPSLPVWGPTTSLQDAETDDSLTSSKTSLSENYTTPTWNKENSSDLTSPLSFSSQSDISSTEENNLEVTTETSTTDGLPASTQVFFRKKNNHMLVGMTTGLGTCLAAGIVLCICWHCLCSRLYAQRQVAPTDLRVPAKPRPAPQIQSRDFR